MYRLVIENQKGEQLRLTQNEDNYVVGEITGLNPPSASILLSENIGDGDEFVHERTGSRNIVIPIYIKGDAEANRIKLYNFIKNGKYIKIYFQNGARNVWIEGRVESIETDLFSMQETLQVSIICPYPWWQSIEEMINSINTIQNKLYFPFYTIDPIPFSVYETIQLLNLINSGDIASGMTIEIYARGRIVNPIIYNRETTEYIGLGNIDRPFEMVAGDRVIITTHTNNKKAKLIRNAEETNIFNYLRQGSKFLQVEAGDNVFTYSADSGHEYVDIKFKHYSNYEGV